MAEVSAFCGDRLPGAEPAKGSSLPKVGGGGVQFGSSPAAPLRSIALHCPGSERPSDKGHDGCV